MIQIIRNTKSALSGWIFLFIIILSLGMTCVLLAEDGKTPTRAQLEEIASESVVEITTIGRKSGEPRTTTIWFVYEKNHLYIQSGQGGKTSWYRNLKKNRHIDMKIGDLTFTGQAHFINDQKETERIHELFRSKYLRARLASWTGSEVGHGKVVEIELPF